MPLGCPACKVGLRDIGSTRASVVKVPDCESSDCGTTIKSNICACHLQSPEAYAFLKTLWQPVLELTHNHGTENAPNFKYHNGNDSPQGFGHIGLLCDDLEKACEELEAAGVLFRKKPQVGLTVDLYIQV